MKSGYGMEEQGSFLNDKNDLTIIMDPCIFHVGKRIGVFIANVPMKNPGVTAPGFFYPIVARWNMPKAGCRLLISIQPFAYVVGGHTCHDGDKKG